MNEEKESLHEILAATPAEVATSVEGEGGTARPVPQETVYRVDRWTRRQAERLASDQAHDIAEDPVGDESPQHVLADTLQAAYDPAPSRVENGPKFRAAFFDMLEASGTLESLRRHTVLNYGLATDAAIGLARQYMLACKEREQNRKDSGDGDGSSEALSRQDMQTLVRAVKGVQDSVETGITIAAGVEEATGGSIDIGLLRQQLGNSLRSPHLRRIIEMMGRYIRLADSLQKRRVFEATPAELVGIVQDGKLSVALPSELIFLAGVVPALRPIYLARLAERRIACWERRWRPKKERGPVVVMLDESSSMLPWICEAKAVAAAIAWVARKQGRPARLISYASSATCHDVSPDNPAGFIVWLENMIGGGTVTTSALGMAMRQHIENADHIIITDGQWSEEPNGPALKGYRNWCDENSVTVYGISLGVVTPQLETVADRVWQMAELGLDSPCVQAVLSI